MIRLSANRILKQMAAQMLRQSSGTTNEVRLGRAPAGQISLPREGIRLEEVERDLLNQALELAEGNRTKAAKLLGLSRDTFRYRLEKFGIGKE